jgi:hypothetical protein
VNTIFSINFRREAFLREKARTRRRAAALGLWVAYFGALAVLLGLYGLNLVSLQRRIALVEHQAEHMRRMSLSGDWRPDRSAAAEVERHVRNPRLWRNRLARLPELLPPNARLSSIQYNPENVGGVADTRLVLSGVMRSGGGNDRIEQVMSFVNTLSRDSVFAAGYQHVRLVTTRAASGTDGAEFVIECR